MARAQPLDSAGSQFLIMHQDGDFLNVEYASFGKVTAGIETVDLIAAVPTDASDRPVAEQKMVSVTVDTQGVDYPAPPKLPDPFGR